MAGSSPSSNKRTSKKKVCGVPGYYVGVISIVLVTLLWVGSSFLTKVRENYLISSIFIRLSRLFSVISISLSS
jgi:hypothetical protein